MRAATRLAVAQVVLAALVASCSSGSGSSGGELELTTATAVTTPDTVTTLGPASTPGPATTPDTVTTPGPASTAPVVMGVQHRSIEVDGIERTYRLYVPASLPAGPVPLVLAFHGGLGWGDQFAQTDHVEALADETGFVVVHPDGVTQATGPGGTWNAGACCGRAAREDVDDVAFVADLIDVISAEYDVDARRVVAIGHSNGAMFSYRLACELSDRITGIGVWAGALEIDTCAPAWPVTVIHGHGDADRNVPIEGGVGPDSIAGVAFAPPRVGFATLAGAAGCPAEVVTSDGDVSVATRAPCAAGTAAAFVTIHTANHAWPGGTPLRVPDSGPGYADWDATTELVTFLLAHPRG